MASSNAWNTAAVEEMLKSMLKDGVVSDLVEVEKSSLPNPAVIDPWSHLPIKLWKSEAVAQAFDIVLDSTLPGTSASYKQVLSSIMNQTYRDVDSFCFLLGGMVRDILKAEVGTDIDFNYTCSAQDVARVCVENAWPLRYYAAAGAADPNKVIIGDPMSDRYIEGFSIHFEAVKDCYRQDFRRNLLYYDLTNKVIIDKPGYAVDDIRAGQLRFSNAPSVDFDLWAGEGDHRADKMLRYAKFITRADVKQEPLKVDEDEAAFVVRTLTKDLRGENTASLKKYWPFALKQCMNSQPYLCALHKWVCEKGGHSWWQEWLPFVKPHVKDESWLQSLGTADTSEAAELKASDIIAQLKTIDPLGSGLVPKDCIETWLVGLGMCTSSIPALLECSGARVGTSVRYEELVRWLLQDQPATDASKSRMESKTSLGDRMESKASRRESKNSVANCQREMAAKFMEKTGPRGELVHDLVEVGVETVEDQLALACFRMFPGVRIYRSETVTKAIRLVCSTPIPGLDGSTFLDVFDTLTKSPGWSYHIFMMGGLLRDMLRRDVGADFDINFTAPAPELKRICEKRGWNCRLDFDDNYILIGDGTNKVYIEGLVITANPVQSYTSDFSMNWLYYDFCNDVIVDKFGSAVPAIKANQLAIPCPRDQWDAWLQSNGSRVLFRFYKFILRDYCYSEDEMTYVAMKLLEYWSTAEEETINIGRIALDKLVGTSDAGKVVKLKEFVFKSFDLAKKNSNTKRPVAKRHTITTLVEPKDIHGKNGSDFHSASVWWTRGWLPLLKLSAESLSAMLGDSGLSD